VTLRQEEAIRARESGSEPASHPASAAEFFSAAASLPENWTAVSLSYSEVHESLLLTRITRYPEGALVDGKACNVAAVRMPLPRAQLAATSAELSAIIAASTQIVKDLTPAETQISASAAATEETSTRWWAGRRALDARLQKVAETVQGWFGPFAGLLQGRSANMDAVITAVAEVQASLRKEYGLNVTEPVMNVLLSNWAGIAVGDKRWAIAALGASPSVEAVVSFLDVAALSFRFQATDFLGGGGSATASAGISFERGPVCLVVDKIFHGFPLECLPVTMGHPVCRSHDLLALLRPPKHAREPFSIPPTVNSSSGFFVLNPGNDLPVCNSLQIVGCCFANIFSPCVRLVAGNTRKTG
jgi:hypothetical protein